MTKNFLVFRWGQSAELKNNWALGSTARNVLLTDFQYRGRRNRRPIFGIAVWWYVVLARRARFSKSIRQGDTATAET
jgi:hypothetical protein